MRAPHVGTFSAVCALAHWLRCALALALLVLGSTCAGATPIVPSDLVATRMIIVAIADRPAPALTAGATPRGYAGLPNYAGSQRAVSVAADLASDYRLRVVSAWTIRSLQLRCMLLRIADASNRRDLLARLGEDRRVLLAQPLRQFSTLAAPSENSAVTPVDGMAAYNDPYVGLQRGFSSIHAAAAQRWSRGEGVLIALIDTGVDSGHPDLRGRISSERDFVGATADAPAIDRHGTEVAGVIAAVANNRLGIVGVAPDVRLNVYRACWPIRPFESAARCNTYTLALALGAAIESDARLINLSLGGPHDALLKRLLDEAIGRGAIVIAAIPPSGRMDGFPVDVPGVIAVASAGDARIPAHALAAPGRDILTLEPGGHFDYASGSSLAAAHVTGTAALLLSIRPRLAARALHTLLAESRAGSGPIDVCRAISLLRQHGNCAAPAQALGQQPRAEKRSATDRSVR